MSQTKHALMRFGGRALAGLIRHVENSSNVTYEPFDLRDRLRETHPCIVACWHGQFMMLASLHPGDVKVSAMVARHGDAELIGEAMRRMNTELIRGAGAGDRKRDRGGASALRASVKALKSTSSLVMTADIPPGPARVAGIGIITIAKMSGCPIVPVAAASKRFLSLDTWSRLTLNLPYSDLVFVGADPIHVPHDADSETLEQKRRELESALNTATVEAYKRAGADVRRATPLDQLAAQSPPPPGRRLKLYRAATAALSPAVPAFLSYRAKKGKEDSQRHGERLGFASRQRPDGPIVWVHAASVGETNAVLPVVTSILEQSNDIHVVLTTGTTTSAALAESRLPARAFHQYVPLDVPLYAERFLTHWQPKLAVFTESDVWPNLILETSKRSIPLVLVNARMSPRSIKRWRKNARIGRVLFSRFSVILAQNPAIASTMKRLGSPNVSVVGNLKIDAPAPPVDQVRLAEMRSAIGNRPVFLASSTHPGEDSIIASAHQIARAAIPGLLTIIVPRHADRGNALANLLMGQGLSIRQRSANSLPDPSTDIYIADTMGELGTFYRLSPLCFVGGSLIEHGGQNPVEAVRLGAAVLSGPHVHNFTDIYNALITADGAAIVHNADDIAARITHLLGENAALETMRSNASLALEQMSGALSATMTALQPFLARAGR